MARTDPIFRLRVPPELVERFRQRAAANGRSMAQEIVVTLEAALDQESDVEILKEAVEALKGGMADAQTRLVAVEKHLFGGGITLGKTKIGRK